MDFFVILDYTNIRKRGYTMDKRIPYGISNYKDLIEDGYYYVDKTMYLHELENAGTKLVYLRPRRFGKTLLTSMMYYYYDIASHDLFEGLYKDTYVYSNPTPNKNNYYVLSLDFSGMNVNVQEIDSVRMSFIERLKNGIKNFINHYELNITTTIFLDFLEQFQELRLDKKIYIIIDEYDNFTNTILSGNPKLFKQN